MAVVPPNKTEFYDEDREQKSYEWVYDPITQEGVETWWREMGGRFMQRHFKNMCHVMTIRWHPNGMMMEKTPYKNGKPDGLCQQWHENGQQEIECLYVDGKKVNGYKHWDENGNVIQ